MNSLLEFVSNPVFWKVIVAYWLFSSVVGALPTPDTSSGKFYQFFFRFMHLLSGNVSRAALKFQLPGAEAEKP
jgi:ABC-type dipeptide/oligopeptide/nickel transport system permease component